jgi:predicted DNA-binding WGR domain protein
MSHSGVGGVPASRLTHVAERFSQFYNDLESEKEHRRLAEEQRRTGLVDQVNKLERSMEAEIKRRMEADKALQVTVEAEMKAMQEAHHQQMRDVQMSMNASVDALSRTLADLHRELQARGRDHTVSACSLRASNP